MKTLFLLLLLPLQLLAQPDTLWTKQYLPNQDASCYVMEQTSEGGYLLAGDITDGGMFLLKTNSNGARVWSRQYQLDGGFVGYWAHQTFDGGYALAGRNGSPAARRESYQLLKTNAQGDTLWSRRYKSAYHFNRCYTAIQTADSGYALAGMIAYGDGYSDGALVWLVKTNAQGDSLWSRTYAVYPPSRVECRFIRQMPDGGYLLGLNNPYYSFGFIRVDSNGDSLWSRSCFNNNDQRYDRSLIYSITPTRDGGYFCAGRYGEWNGLGWRWARLDANFDTLWTGQYLASTQSHGSEAHAAVEMPDGGFVVAGFDSTGYAMLRLNRHGNTQWIRQHQQSPFSPGGHPECWAMVKTPEGGFALAGFSYLPEHSNRSPLLVVTGPDAYRAYEVRPESLSFDSVNVGENAQTSLTFFNWSGAPVMVDNPTLADSDNFSVLRLGQLYVPPDDSTVFLVSCHPQDTGAVSTTLTFNMMHPPRPSVVPLSGFGVRHLAAASSGFSPQEFQLFPNYPNPFNPETRISFDLPHAAPTQLQIFDVSGRAVSTLINGMTASGHHDISFNARALPSGVYFYHLQSGDFSATRKMLLLK